MADIKERLRAIEAKALTRMRQGKEHNFARKFLRAKKTARISSAPETKTH